MMKCLWLPALLLAAFYDTAAVQAGTRICNDTEALHQLAVTLHTGGRWVAQGWQPLPPGGCVEPAPQGYSRKFFYFRVEGPGYSFRDDSVRFCTAPGRFRIADDAACELPGQSRQGFAKAQAGAEDRTIPLSGRSQTASGGAAAAALREIRHDAQHAALHADGSHYAVDVVFQGCTQQASAAMVTCKFVGNGMEIGAAGRVQISDPVFTYLLGLLRGAPLAIDGEMIATFGSFGELELHSVTPRVPNRFDRMLQQMQGEWVSESNRYDSFSISGAQRRVRYEGVEMSPEFIAVQGSCKGAGGGDFLLAWDSLRDSSLCYRIKSLTEDRMTLIYLPRGIRLDYRRLQ
ncbi:DUF1036 domain-containing protein [Leisingera sp. JC11]|uniref:DUF1036 domain-containing protein n=1 Tax=Leisingera sp. JC11 TaxID=3042469 RepID=UPI0034553BB9